LLTKQTEQGKAMEHLSYKTLMVKLSFENFPYFIQLLKASGYKVEIQECSSVESNTENPHTKITLEGDIGNVINRDNLLVQNTCLHIQKNLNSKLMLDDIATKVGSNRSKLAASFKQILGVGVFEWTREHRMLKAKSLLIESNLSIQEIGFEVGYENCANFSTAFKKYFKISPRQQRKLTRI
jgi:AraC-like DNA-binding protein